MFRTGVHLLALAAAGLSACSYPRAHARVLVTPGGVRVAPTLSATIGDSECRSANRMTSKMLRSLAVVAALLTLASCGADGTPKPPAKSAVSVTGSVEIGIAGEA